MTTPLNKATCKTCGAIGPPWNHKPTPLAPNHGTTPSDHNKQQDELREKLAAIEHERWADWQKWCHHILRDQVSSSDELEAVLKRWDRQIETSYYELSEKEKQSDRDQVMRYWPLIQRHIEAECFKAQKEKLRMLRKVLGESIVEFIDQELAQLQEQENKDDQL